MEMPINPNLIIAWKGIWPQGHINTTVFLIWTETETFKNKQPHDITVLIKHQLQTLKLPAL